MSFTLTQRLELHGLAEGAGIHAAKFKRCLKKVAAKQVGGSEKSATSMAYAICTTTFQKAGYFKAGTADLTAKGKKAMPDAAEEAGVQIEAKGGDPKKKLKNAVMGMSGGAIAAVRATRELRPSLEKTDKGQEVLNQLDVDLAVLDQVLSRLKGTSSKLA